MLVHHQEKTRVSLCLSVSLFLSLYLAVQNGIIGTVQSILHLSISLNQINAYYTCNSIANPYYMDL